VLSVISHFAGVIAIAPWQFMESMIDMDRLFIL